MSSKVHNFITSLPFSGKTEAHDTKCRKWCNFPAKILLFASNFTRIYFSIQPLPVKVNHRPQHLSVKINIVIEHHFTTHKRSNKYRSANIFCLAGFHTFNCFFFFFFNIKICVTDSMKQAEMRETDTVIAILKQFI